MPGLYIGSTSGYSGKNTVALGIGLWFQKKGYSVGYIKPVGAMPTMIDGEIGDEDAAFVQKVLGLAARPSQVTPVVITQDFKVSAFTGQCPDLMPEIKAAYQALSDGKDLTLVAGSGSMYSGKYCGVDGLRVVRELDLKCVIVDRFSGELHYDYLAVMGETLGERLTGVVLNDVPLDSLEQVQGEVAPFLERAGVRVLGVIPKDSLMGAIRVGDLAERLGGRIITAQAQADRVVEEFLIGTMQVENFLTHFKKHKNAAVIVGGDRSDVQLVALEGAPCLVLTGNLYPNDIIVTRSEVQDIPIIVVREDTFSVAKKMEAILSRHKLRDEVKVRQAARIVAQHLDLEALKTSLGL